MKLSRVGEDALLASLMRQLPKSRHFIGDDCAVIEFSGAKNLNPKRNLPPELWNSITLKMILREWIPKPKPEEQLPAAVRKPILSRKYFAPSALSWIKNRGGC